MLFRKNIDPRCAYCARGNRINDEQVACVRRAWCLRPTAAARSDTTR